MAKVKMLVDMTGSRQGASGRQEDWPRRGEILEVSEDEAGQLVEGRMAEFADGAARRRLPGRG